MSYEESAVLIFKIGFLEGFCAAKRMPDYDTAWRETEETLKRVNLVKLLKLPENR